MDALALHKKTVSRLKLHKGKYAQIASESGLSYSTLAQFAQGHLDNPTVGTLQLVIAGLDAFEAKHGVPEDPEASARRIDSPEAVASEFAIPPQAPAGSASPAPETDPEAGRVEPFVENP